MQYSYFSIIMSIFLTGSSPHGYNQPHPPPPNVLRLQASGHSSNQESSGHPSHQGMETTIVTLATIQYS